MDELWKIKRLKISLVWELNELQQKYTQNPYDEKNIWQIMYLREKINRLTKKIDTLQFKDMDRE